MSIFSNTAQSQFYGKTRKEVDDKLTKAKHDTGRGLFVAPHRLTVGDWLDIWLADYKRPELRPKTFDKYELMANRHLKPAIGHMPLQDLRPEHVQHLYNNKLGKPKAKGIGMIGSDTVRAMHQVLHGALKQAEKNHMVFRNVCTLVNLPRNERREMKTLTLNQVVNNLLPAIEGDRLAAAIMLFFTSGLRHGELLGLRWQDIDFDAEVLTVRQALVEVKNRDGGARKWKLVFMPPKTTSSRRVLPISPNCISALKRHKARQAEEKLLMGTAYQDQDFVFCRQDGKPMAPSSLRWQFRRMLTKAGLPHIRVHDARHSFATLMLEQGESPKTVQTLMGHSQISTTLDIYSHVSLELETRAVNRLDEAFKNAAKD